MSVRRYNSEIEESKTGGFVSYTEYAALEAERDELKSKLAYATLGFDKLVVERDALRQRCEGMHTYCLRNEVFFLRPDGTFQHIPQNLWEDLAAQEKEKK